jgi:hypothetical protein
LRHAADIGQQKVVLQSVRFGIRNGHSVSLVDLHHRSALDRNPTLHAIVRTRFIRLLDRSCHSVPRQRHRPFFV